MDLVDDILADPDPDPDPVSDPDAEPVPPHPHDRTVALRIDRRPGSVAPREMHCLCPIRSAPERRSRTPVGG
jgi:hypothetical protein